jgi:hypothetical protein
VLLLYSRVIDEAVKCICEWRSSISHVIINYFTTEHVNHIQDRQNSTCEKYLTARSPQYHVFQALSYFSRGSRREIVNYDMGNR